jgi:hypothetical protein
MSTAATLFFFVETDCFKTVWELETVSEFLFAVKDFFIESLLPRAWRHWVIR